MKTIKQSAGMGYEAPDICFVGYFADNIICTSASGGQLEDVTVEEYGEI